MRDKSFSFLVAPQANGVHVVNSGRDGSARLLGRLGLQLSAAVQRLPDSATVGRAKLSCETGYRRCRCGFRYRVTGFAAGAQGRSGLRHALRGAGEALHPARTATGAGVGLPSPGSLQWSLRELVPKQRALR
ncbi:hypothetical protein [Sciscionella marina]|uniref:hypothetical protein n=1 Tax=Sciscionella marina TaxID=508770 RepID=UPI00037DB77F|nr:hypothetical protein [Sciscionella marina]